MNLAKKLIVVLITAAMLFTLVPLAAFAADTTTATTAAGPVSTVPVAAPVIPYADIFGTPYESSFIKLHLMGIFTGYPDQTFKPDRLVTRSEFLAVAIRSLNFEKYVSGFKGATQYPDTAIDHWATGYINVGTAFGIIKGYPDGTFRPDSNVSYAEATTMLVRMLGYTQYLTPVTPGGGTEDWFANFVKMALAMGDPKGFGLDAMAPPLLDLPEGILTGVQNFNAASPASRGDLAIMAYNSLYVFPLIQYLWSSTGPVPGGTFFRSRTTLSQNMGYYEMETFVTNAPNYDTYAGNNQIELFEGWTLTREGWLGSTRLPAGTFVPYGRGFTMPDGTFIGETDPVILAHSIKDVNGRAFRYPFDFSPVHRLYSYAASAIWVGGQPASLVDLIGKPVRVIYKGSEPFIGQAPFPEPSTLYYVRTLPCEVLTRKIAAQQVPLANAGLGQTYRTYPWYPGKTVGEILDSNIGDFKLKVYQANVAAKTLETLTIDPRAVVFLEDTMIENPYTMLVKDSEVKMVRALQQTANVRDYEGHIRNVVLQGNAVWAILAKVFPGHIIKNTFVRGDYVLWNTTAPDYDIWGRTLTYGTAALDFVDNDTFNHKYPTPYPAQSDYTVVRAEDDAKIILDGTQYTVQESFTNDYIGYYTGTARLAPLKYYPINDSGSLSMFKGDPSSMPPHGNYMLYAQWNPATGNPPTGKYTGYGSATVSATPHTNVVGSPNQPNYTSNIVDITVEYKVGPTPLLGVGYFAWLLDAGGNAIVPPLPMGVGASGKAIFPNINWLSTPVVNIVISWDPLRPGLVPTNPIYVADLSVQFSLIKFEGVYDKKSGTLEQVFRTRDQNGIDWVTSLKVSGSTYEVLWPGTGEFPVVAASVTGPTISPTTAGNLQIPSVESGATLMSSRTLHPQSGGNLGAYLVMNNLWNELPNWLGQPIDLYMSPPAASGGVAKVRYIEQPYIAAVDAWSKFGMATNIILSQDSSFNYHLSLNLLEEDGLTHTYPFLEATVNDVLYIYIDVDYYIGENRGQETRVSFNASNWYPANSPLIPAIYTALAGDGTSPSKGIVRDLVKLTHANVGLSGTTYEITKIQELTTNPDGTWNTSQTEGFLDSIGPVFSGDPSSLVFSLEDFNRLQLIWSFPTDPKTPIWGNTWRIGNPDKVASRAMDMNTTAPINVQWLGAKNSITVPWQASSNTEPGTIIFDASNPPYVKQISVAQLAQLTGNYWVQVFFRPVARYTWNSTPNPYMIDRMLVNGEYVPVIKFIVIRPSPCAPARLVRFSPNSIGPYPFPIPSQGTDISAQFDKTIDPERSQILVYNNDTGEYIEGDTVFYTTVHENDTMAFYPNLMPEELFENGFGLGLPYPERRGNYTVFALAYVPNMAVNDPNCATRGSWSFLIDLPAVVPSVLNLFPYDSLLTLPEQTTQDLNVQLCDQFNWPMAGKTVSLSTDFGDLSDVSVTTDEWGWATFSITSEVDGTANIMAFYGALEAFATVTWQPDLRPTTLLLEPEQQDLSLPDETVADLAVTVLDQYGDPMPGQEVALTTDFGWLSEESVWTDEFGQAGFSISSTEAGTANIEAMLGALATPATVTWAIPADLVILLGNLTYRIMPGLIIPAAGAIITAKLGAEVLGVGTADGQGDYEIRFIHDTAFDGTINVFFAGPGDPPPPPVDNTYDYEFQPGAYNTFDAELPD